MRLAASGARGIGQRTQLMIVSVVILAASGLALLEASARTRMSREGGHSELTALDLANGASEMLRNDSVLIVRQTPPAKLADELRSIRTRRETIDARIGTAQREVESAMNRAHTDETVGHVLKWASYSGMVLVVLLWALHFRKS